MAWLRTSLNEPGFPGAVDVGIRGFRSHSWRLTRALATPMTGRLRIFRHGPRASGELPPRACSVTHHQPRSPGYWHVRKAGQPKKDSQESLNTFANERPGDRAPYTKCRPASPSRLSIKQSTFQVTRLPTFCPDRIPDLLGRPASRRLAIVDSMRHVGCRVLCRLVCPLM